MSIWLPMLQALLEKFDTVSPLEIQALILVITQTPTIAPFLPLAQSVVCNAVLPLLCN
jgi:hypothetical protein